MLILKKVWFQTAMHITVTSDNPRSSREVSIHCIGYRKHTTGQYGRVNV